MKSTFLFSTRLRMFLTELPAIFFLVLAIIYNDTSEELLKLYPLIVLLSAIIIFIFLYLFRAVIIRYDEVRTIGLFSSREQLVLNKDKALVITLQPRNFIVVEVFGEGKNFETYAWLKNEDSCEINLFRAKAYGTVSSLRAVLRNFDVDENTIDRLIERDGERIELKEFILSSATVHDGKSISIFFKETI